MLRLRSCSTCAIISMALLSLTLAWFPFPAVAQSNSGEYIFLLASGSLCDPNDSSTCPATAKSSQGDAYEISGAGTFDAEKRSVHAAGTYTHRSPNGNAVETGVWLAGELLSFSSYGAAPNALPRPGWATGQPLYAVKRLPTPSGPVPTGGLAVLRIRLLPLQGPPRNAVLQVNSALGDVPRERSVEGIRLSFEGNANYFSEEAGGRALFLTICSFTRSQTQTGRIPEKIK